MLALQFYLALNHVVENDIITLLERTLFFVYY
jgi:hypothetical protein